MNDKKQPLKFYSLISGIFIYDENVMENLPAHFVSCSGRNPDHAESMKHFGRNYYPNYLSNILFENQGQGFIRRVTSRQVAEVTPRFVIPLQSDELKFIIPYFDLFLFTEGVGIFVFKVQMDEAEEINYSKISLILKHLRNPEATLKADGSFFTVKEWIGQSIEPGLKLIKNWSENIPQLKTYTIVEDWSRERFHESLDFRLFEIAHMLPENSVKDSEFSPSELYYNYVQANHTISVFNNWKAISLFDSFTRLSTSFADHFQSWEREYFLIYIHCLFTKFKLYQFNNQFKDVLQVSHLTKKLRDDFIEFINDYNLAYISYKFLPNHLYEKIFQTIEIEKELNRMELKISRLNEAMQERKGKQLNNIIFILSLISIASVVGDLSQWLIHIGLPASIIYSKVTAAAVIITIIFIAVFIVRKYKLFK